MRIAYKFVCLSYMFLFGFGYQFSYAGNSFDAAYIDLKVTLFKAYSKVLLIEKRIPELKQERQLLAQEKKRLVTEGVALLHAYLERKDTA